MLLSNIRKFFNNTITVYRRENIDDNKGGYISKFKKKYWDVACRIYGLRGPSYKIGFDGEDYLVTRKLMAGRDDDIKEGDKITDDKYGNSYLILSSYPVNEIRKVSHIECLLTRVEGVAQ